MADQKIEERTDLMSVIRGRMRYVVRAELGEIVVAVTKLCEALEYNGNEEGWEIASAAAARLEFAADSLYLRAREELRRCERVTS